jgi:hypothetical protein
MFIPRIKAGSARFGTGCKRALARRIREAKDKADKVIRERRISRRFPAVPYSAA